MDRNSESIARALAALRRAQSRRALSRLARERGRRGPVPDAVYELLDVVAAAGRPPTVTEVAAALGTDQPRASRLTAQALDAGLVHRRADQMDGRRSLLEPTAEGRRALAEIQGFRARVVAEVTAGWDPADRAALAELLARFTEDFTALVR
ncbi:MarR family winged helix-turn-helix transcriptional regulator [Amycolatopsis granulosa]|uniref:MarR family winged helix-turn-helix transcriptional regulator n=1 Tax=Amycolatopsis granulosa TaxID=185684 RepID=UPI001420B5D7|nr:MarR family winged helix-turn-helix transcriptional regulator [Amycolatopsis granulosa]NIH88478.1 DNA-binding MarR family transcriptional regulator [Amycolatopsis granulosa]